MRLVRRYRRITMKKAIKPWSPLFVLDADEVVAQLVGGRR